MPLIENARQCAATWLNFVERTQAAKGAAA
jgi:hypothetical protein